MKIKKAFRDFLTTLESKSDKFNNSVSEEDYKQFQTTFFEDLLELLQRKESLFDKERLIFGSDLSELWKELDSKTKTSIWKQIQSCCVYCFLHGDISEKIEEIMSLLMPMFKKMDGYNEEIDKILGKEDSKSKFVEIFEYLKESKLLTVFIYVFENVDFSGLELGEDVDIESIKSNKSLLAIQEQIQESLKSKLQSGEISQSDIQYDLQMITSKVQAIFGDSMNDMLGTRKGPDAKTALSNSPEARRARMVARLQRKVAEKK